MVKLLVPLILGLIGLGAGIGAGLALKPASEGGDEQIATACDTETGHAGSHAGEAGSAAVSPDNCEPPKSDPFSEALPEGGHAGSPDKLVYAPIDKPFVVPVFADERVVSMVVASLAVETDADGIEAVSAIEPRLRDRFLNVMFLHSNSGGFDGSFTNGRRMDDLKAALLKAAREVLPDAHVSDVLITEIARQDV